MSKQEKPDYKSRCENRGKSMSEDIGMALMAGIMLVTGGHYGIL